MEKFVFFTNCRRVEIVVDLDNEAKARGLKEEKVKDLVRNKFSENDLYAIVSFKARFWVSMGMVDLLPVVEKTEFLSRFYSPKKLWVIRSSFWKKIEDPITGLIQWGTTPIGERVVYYFIESEEGWRKETFTDFDKNRLMKEFEEHTDIFLKDYLRVNEEACKKRGLKGEKK